MSFYCYASTRLVKENDHSTELLWCSEAIQEMWLNGWKVIDKFQTWQLQPGEVLSVFCRNLRKLLDQEMPDIESKTHDQLQLHQFVAGLSLSVSKQLHASWSSE